MDKVFEKLSMASIIQYFMPGIPIVFAGTEVGVTGYKDPFNRKPYPWDNPNKKILAYYRHLGRLRECNRDFFSEAGDVKIQATEKYVEIIRRNSQGERILKVRRGRDS